MVQLVMNLTVVTQVSVQVQSSALCSGLKDLAVQLLQLWSRSQLWLRFNA